MDAPTFLGLQSTHNPYRWVLLVTPGVCTPGGSLFGGCALGAAIAALEVTTGRPVVWAAAQYLAYARPPEVLDLDVTVAVASHHTARLALSGTSRIGRCSPSMLPSVAAPWRNRGHGRSCPGCQIHRNATPRVFA